MSVLLEAIIMSEEGMTVSTLRSFRELHRDLTAGTQMFWIVPSLPVTVISSVNYAISLPRSMQTDFDLIQLSCLFGDCVLCRKASPCSDAFRRKEHNHGY